MSTELAGGSWPGPVGRPARAHWWSAQPPPPARRISARRGYAEVAAVFAAFFAASIIAGGETLAGRYPAPSGSWAVFTPAAVSELATSALAVVVVIVLSARRGITPRQLGFGMPRKASGRPALGQSFRVGAWALAALVLGGAVTALLATGRLGQPARSDNSYLLYATAASVAAGVVEECVVLAFVVTTLRQAGRPLLEITLVAVALRCSYHDYYGLGVAGIALWAAVFVWLFLRTGSVLPLIVMHFLWDETIYLGQRWPAVLSARALAGLLLLVVAGITWLADSLARGGGWPEPGAGLPPGGLPPGGVPLGGLPPAWPPAAAPPSFDPTEGTGSGHRPG
ncbi:MAG TPA: CPBP family intramembrane glutamic endopeptidase [Streptosporangiaceae bacterium]|nr:CPBP family intramembrane glutamic endopeptidase [Streptosporangiaceae bacterium]